MLTATWRSVWRFLKNTATEHTAFPLLGVYLGKTINRQHTGTKKFSAALFTRAWILEQSKCPWMENMDKEDVVIMYNGILLSHEMNEIRRVAATRMELDTIILSDICQTEKETYYKISLICGI